MISPKMIGKVTVEYVAAGIMERKYCFPNAFVVDYKEDYGDEAGTVLFGKLFASTFFTLNAPVFGVV